MIRNVYVINMDVHIYSDLFDENLYIFIDSHLFRLIRFGPAYYHICMRHAKLPVVPNPYMSFIRSAFEHRTAGLFSGSTVCILFSLIIDVFERIYFTAIFKFTKDFIIIIYVLFNRTRSSSLISCELE